MNTETQEPKYILTEYVANEREVSEGTYVEHLGSKLDYAFEEAANLTLKIKRMQLELNKMSDKMAEITAKIIQVKGEEFAKGRLEYSKWRFKELYPKKFAGIYSEEK